jgi:predicted Zn-dependent protease
MQRIAAGMLLALLLAGCGAPSREDLRTQALSQYQVGQTMDAKVTLERLLAQYPGDPDGLYLMGRICQSEHAYPQALYYYRSCLETAPWHEPARRWLTNAEQESGLKAEPFQLEPQ